MPRTTGLRFWKLKTEQFPFWEEDLCLMAHQPQDGYSPQGRRHLGRSHP